MSSTTHGHLLFLAPVATFYRSLGLNLMDQQLDQYQCLDPVVILMLVLRISYVLCVCATVHVVTYFHILHL